MNWMLIPTLLLALVLFRAGQVMNIRLNGRGVRHKALLIAGGCAAALPGVLIALYYVMHGRGAPAWFYAFRTLPGSELTAAGAGLLAGVLAGLPRRPGARLAVRPVLLALLLIGVAAPHLKPLLAPLRQQQFTDRWRDGVCLQSLASTCGPASAATIFKMFGVELNEQQLARECHTYRGGTEAWYLARAFRRRGFDVSFYCYPDLPEKLPIPSIAGVMLAGGMGHFVPLLAETAEGYVIGDPLPGKKVFPKADVDLGRGYRFTGFFMAVRKRGA